MWNNWLPMLVNLLYSTHSLIVGSGCKLPFCTIDPNIGVVSVPDQRLEKLSRFLIQKK